jgi:hypothetical protein
VLVGVVCTTDTLRCFVIQDGELALTSTSKAGLLGFYNPCIGEDQSIADAQSVSSSAVKPLL